MSPLILALLPFATQFVVPMVEKLIGGKKSPTDTATGQSKLDNATAILQQASAVLGVSGTTADLQSIINLAVQILKPFGLDNIATGGVLTSVPTVLNGTYPIVFTGSIQIGAVK